MPRNFIDLTGEKYGRLLVLDIAGRHPGNGNILWRCQCDCGNITVVRSQYLRIGRVKTADKPARGTLSCGCLHKERASEANKIHGFSVSENHLERATHHVWSEMIHRCTNPNSMSYSRYGGKGITVDPRWMDFQTFIEDMGVRPADGYYLARTSIAVNYNADNCFWDLIAYRRKTKSGTRITLELAKSIREEYHAGGITHRELGEKYGLGTSTIQHICAGHTWKT